EESDSDGNDSKEDIMCGESVKFEIIQIESLSEKMDDSESIQILSDSIKDDISEPTSDTENKPVSSEEDETKTKEETIFLEDDIEENYQ
ncbi:hypothetical protein, partial [Klebsiella pneumoniae]|uniref:hypothetical protein n=1 Tax=Klebsiella pneumoniae TaxID=573 RepID=UPI0040555B04